jgi:hypothetical protein
MQTPDDLDSIGRNALITVSGIIDVPAKVDTGADTSSVWATNIHERDNKLHFTLFGEDSTFYTGEELTLPEGKYKQVEVYSSSGDCQIRYKVALPVTVEGKDLEARFTLADRKAMAYPVLLGRNFLNGQFLVDVSQGIDRDIHRSLKQQKRARNGVA